MESSNVLLKKFYVPRDIPVFILKNLLEFIYKIEITGTENIPLVGGAVLVCNHTDWLDVPIIGVYPPRKITFLAKNELFYPQEEAVKLINSPSPLFQNPIFSLIKQPLESILNLWGGITKEHLELWGGVPIIRHFQGDGAKAAVEYYEKVEEQMIEILKSGEILSVFPEGTRTQTGTMAPFKGLAAKIAIRANVPIIPSGISGAWKMSSQEAFLSGKAFKAKINYNIGNPIPPEQFPAGNEKKASKLLTEELEKRVNFLTQNPERRKKSRRFAQIL